MDNLAGSSQQQVTQNRQYPYELTLTQIYFTYVFKMSFWKIIKLITNKDKVKQVNRCCVQQKSYSCLYIAYCDRSKSPGDHMFDFLRMFNYFSFTFCIIMNAILVKGCNVFFLLRVFLPPSLRIPHPLTSGTRGRKDINAS